MDDAAFVRSAERLGHLHRQLELWIDREAAAWDQFSERPAIDQLHRDHEPALDVLGLVDRYDVRVAECGDCLRFAAESLAPARVGGEIVGDDLERDEPVEARISGLVHLAHVACADQGDDLVGSHRCSRTKGHGCEYKARELTSRAVHAPSRRTSCQPIMPARPSGPASLTLANLHPMLHQ